MNKAYLYGTSDDFSLFELLQLPNVQIIKSATSGNDLVMQYSIYNLFYNADLSNSNFKNTNLSNVVFQETDLSNTIFYNADLSNSVFLNTNLSNVVFQETDLSNTIFQNVNFESIEFLDSDHEFQELDCYNHIMCN